MDFLVSHGKYQRIDNRLENQHEIPACMYNEAILRINVHIRVNTSFWTDDKVGDRGREPTDYTREKDE